MEIEWDAPKTAVLVEGEKQKPIYPIAVSVDGQLMLSENVVETIVRGKWSAAFLISRRKQVILVEIRDDRAVFRI